MNIVEVYRKFPTEADCIAYLEQARWHGTPMCPYCNSNRTTPMPSEQRHHCNNCNTTFSVTVGTIFHHTHVPLQKWFLAVSLILNAKKGIASRQLGRDLEVTKDTAWSMGMRIRRAMLEPEQRDLLRGMVEMDETYVGGKARKGNKRDDDEPNKRGRGTKKTPIIGLAQRGGKVKAKVVPSRRVTYKTLRYGQGQRGYPEFHTDHGRICRL
jgi:transposase-like protein